MSNERNVISPSANDMLEEKGIRLKKANLDEIIKYAKDVLDRAEDYAINVKDIISITDENFRVKINDEIYNVKDWAINYICHLYQIPKSFLNRTLNKSIIKKYKPFSGLINNIVNTYIQAPGNENMLLMVRVLDKNLIRAFRSWGKFKVRDNYPLLKSCEDTIKNYFDISSAMIDEDIMILRMYLKQDFEVKGKKVKIGVQMKNSETGYYTLNLKALVNIDGVEFATATLLNVKHNSSIVKTVDVNKYLINIAVDKKDDVFAQIKDLVVNDDLDNKSFQNFLDRLKSVIDKKDYDMVVELNPQKKKSVLAKEVLGVVKDYNFIKKEKVENIISDLFYKVYMSLDESTNSLQEETVDEES